MAHDLAQPINPKAPPYHSPRPNTYLQVQGVVEDDLRRRDAELHDAIVNLPRALQGPEALLEVHVQAPQLETPETTKVTHAVI